MKAIMGLGGVFLLACCLLGQQANERPALPEAPSQSILKSKSFILPHAALFLSIGLDGELSRNVHHHDPGSACKEANHLFRGKNGDFQAGRFYAYNLSIAAGITAADYLLRQKFPHNRWVKWATISAPVFVPFGFGDHMHSASSWLACM